MKTMLGKANHNLDSKNRLFIPSKFRDSLGDSFVICEDAYEKCLRMYPTEEWDKYIERIDSSTEIDDDMKRDILRILCENADTVTPDSQGRVVINSTLKEIADIEKSVVISGAGPYAELWAEKHHEDKVADKRLNSFASVLKKIR